MPNASEVIAATAGAKETWKKDSGRKDGRKGYKLFDFTRKCIKKRNNKNRVNAVLQDKTCHVCFCEIESREEWFITKSCGHATCLDCFLQYMKSQIADDEHRGDLKCAQCTETLTESDIVKVFEKAPELMDAWDEKIRNNLLIDLKSFRPCPKCDANPKARFGGGFVTSACLEGVISERKQDIASKLKPIKSLEYPVIVTISVAMSLGISYNMYHGQTTVCYELLRSWVLHRMYLFFKLYMVHYEQEFSREILSQAIDVQCPCCSEDFVLNTEAELNGECINTLINDNEKWIQDNTRECPGCRAPVTKSEGCNHMRCANCKKAFCWACMKLGNKCGAFKCHNGAPFGDATWWDNNSERQRPQIASNATQMTDYERRKIAATNIGYPDFIVAGICIVIYFQILFPVLRLIVAGAFIFSLIVAGAFIFGVANTLDGCSRSSQVYVLKLLVYGIFIFGFIYFQFGFFVFKMTLISVICMSFICGMGVIITTLVVCFVIREFFISFGLCRRRRRR